MSAAPEPTQALGGTSGGVRRSRTASGAGSAAATAATGSAVGAPRGTVVKAQAAAYTTTREK